MEEEILTLFKKKHYTPYSIHIHTGISFKQVQHVIARDKESIQHHKNVIAAKRLEDAQG